MRLSYPKGSFSKLRSDLRSLLLILAAFLSYDSAESAETVASDKKGSVPAIEKIEDVVIYSDPCFYSSFPSVVKTDDGEILVAFRRAPDRAIFRESGTSHIDSNSYFVCTRSKDVRHWSEAKVFFAHPYGGIQDPCMLKLKNGDLLCSGYLWAPLRPDGVANMEKPFKSNGGAVFGGGFLLRSDDDGNSWEGPFNPISVPTEINHSPTGGIIPAYNRGALYEGANGDIYWAVAGSNGANRSTTSVFLLVSHDKGESWEYRSVIADDARVSFNETSMYETPGGDLIAFLRTANYNDQACIARSKDGGKTFTWQGMGFQGHPINALRLPDKRVLITYGYRHSPFGVRARILNPECTDFDTAQEFVLRDDAANSDVGYSWPVLIDRKKVLVVYYINTKDNKTRHIEGTIIRI